jgi:hypothetical protein
MANQELINALFLRIDAALRLASHLLDILDDELDKRDPAGHGVAGETSAGIVGLEHNTGDDESP